MPPFAEYLTGVLNRCWMIEFRHGRNPTCDVCIEIPSRVRADPLSLGKLTELFFQKNRVLIRAMAITSKLYLSEKKKDARS
jgi:hypothetical protein